MRWERHIGLPDARINLAPSTTGVRALSTDMPPSPFVEQLCDLAVEAGEAILRIYRDPSACASVAKSDGSPVTRADAAAEAIIEAGLAQLAPGVAVVAEEAVAAGRIPAAADRFFLVDPLDGTREFLARNGEFTVNIALSEHGRPVIGVVHAPDLGELWCGVVDQGAWGAAVRQRSLSPWRLLHVRSPPPAGVDVVASRALYNAATAEFLSRFKVRSRTQAGSSLKFCRIAEGVADLYPRFAPTNEWDTAAGHAILSAAGGDVRTIDGGPLLYGKRGRLDAPDFLNSHFVAFGGFDPFDG